MSVSWFLIGVFVGVDVGLFYGWWSHRRANRRFAQKLSAGVAEQLRDVSRQPW